jgi:hypothetical protein
MLEHAGRIGREPLHHLTAAGADLDAGADITIVLQPLRGDTEARMHAAADAYIPLSPVCAGHTRLAMAAGNAVIQPDAGSLAAWFSRRVADAA